MFNSVNARSSLSAGHSALSNFNIIFRRWENARFTILTNTGHSASGSSGVSHRTKVTQAESTFGAGKKQSAGILNQSRGSRRM